MRIQQFIYTAVAVLAVSTASVSQGAVINYLGFYNARGFDQTMGANGGQADFSPVGVGFAGGDLYSRGNSGNSALVRLSAPSIAPPPTSGDNLNMGVDAQTLVTGAGTGDFSGVSATFNMGAGGGQTISAGDVLVINQAGNNPARLRARNSFANLNISNADVASGIDFVGATYHASRGTIFALDASGDLVELNPTPTVPNPLLVNTFSANNGTNDLDFSAGTADTGDVEYVVNPITGQEALLVVGAGQNTIRRITFDSLGAAVIQDFDLPAGSPTGLEFTGLAVDSVNDWTYLSANDGNIYVYGSIVATAVPEPGTFALLTCVGLAGAVRQRRRKAQAAKV